MRRGFAWLMALVLTACMPAANRAEGYGTRRPLRTPALSDVPVHGSPVWVRFDDGRRIKGELLTAEPGGEVVVLSKRFGEQHGSFDQLRRVTVQVDRNAHKWLMGTGSATAVLVPLSAIAGYYALALAPVVGVGGMVAMIVIWAESRVVLRGDDLRYLGQYARWPQGWPEQDWPSVVASEPLPSGVKPIGPDIEPARAPAPEPVPVQPMPLPR